MRDVSRELNILSCAEELLEDTAALELVKNQKVSISRGEIKVVGSLVSEVLRAHVIVSAIQANKTHLIEDGLAKKVSEALPNATLKNTFEQGILSANKTTQDIALSAALDQITQRIRALIEIIEGSILFNTSLLKKN